MRVHVRMCVHGIILKWVLLQQSEINKTFARELEFSMSGCFSAMGCTEHIFK